MTSAKELFLDVVLLKTNNRTCEIVEKALDEQDLVVIPRSLFELLEKTANQPYWGSRISTEGRQCDGEQSELTGMGPD